MTIHPWPLNIIGELPACRDYDPSKVPEETVLVGETKHDGRRLLAVKRSGSSIAYGRRVSNVSGTYEPQQLDLSVLMSNWPDNTAVDGELFVLGQHSSAVATAIAEGDDLEFLAFAMPFLDGEDLRAMPYMENRELMILEHGIDCVAIQATWHRPPTREQVYEIARSRRPRLEGLVLKDISAPYGVSWYKCKEARTVDCVVTGFTDGRGKYMGLVGSLRCSVHDSSGKLVEICKASGMDDDTRVAIDEEKDLGRVVEIEYQEVDSQGRLRFPRFVRWRDDKSAMSCVTNQLEGRQA
jgi:ATP-dependent DNA ligase